MFLELERGSQMNETVSLQINKCKTYIDFMLKQQQWSGLTRADVDRWLNNFKSLTERELLLAYKILANLIYFSEADVIEALKEGIHKCLYYDVLLRKQIEAGFSLSQKALSNVAQEEMEQTCFVPLLDSDSPHESGNYVTRTLVQQGIISSERSVFIDKLPERFASGGIKNLVIVDDCVGSGQQLSSFWRYAKIKDGESINSLQDLCAKYGIKAHYLTLFGYDVSLKKLRDAFSNLRIHCVRMLTDRQRVFSDNGYMWSDSGEREQAIKLFRELCQGAGIPLYGYENLDFAFIMHRTIPDWSIPLLWKENADWKLLMRRKNSHG